jgi:N-acetylglutamate synthase-like GNAT family acetyltransferase
MNRSVLITIRKASREDAVQAFDIRRAAILDQCKSHYPGDALKSWTDGEASERFQCLVEERLYLAVHEGCVIGTGMIDTQTGAIDAVFVHPDKLRMGAGRMIMNYLEAIAREHGLQSIKIESTLNAAPFYRACGFEGAELSQYVTTKGLRLDCIPMTKALVSNDTVAE